MIDRNSPLLDQMREATKNASNEDREYWAHIFREGADEIERLLAENKRLVNRSLQLDPPEGLSPHGKTKKGPE